MNDSKIDDKIREALSDEDAKLYEQFDVEPSLLELALDTMKGRNRWVSILCILIGFGLMAAGGFSIWKLSLAQSVHSLVYWSIGLGVCFGTISMMKIWYWLEMHRNSVTREIKRLELQVARLSQQFKDAEARN